MIRRSNAAARDGVSAAPSAEILWRPCGRAIRRHESPRISQTSGRPLHGGCGSLPRSDLLDGAARGSQPSQRGVSKRKRLGSWRPLRPPLQAQSSRTRTGTPRLPNRGDNRRMAHGAWGVRAVLTISFRFSMQRYACFDFSTEIKYQHGETVKFETVISILHTKSLILRMRRLPHVLVSSLLL